MGFSFRLKA